MSWPEGMNGCKVIQEKLRNMLFSSGFCGSNAHPTGSLLQPIWSLRSASSKCQVLPTAEPLFCVASLDLRSWVSLTMGRSTFWLYFKLHRLGTPFAEGAIE